MKYDFFSHFWNYINALDHHAVFSLISIVVMARPIKLFPATGVPIVGHRNISGDFKRPCFVKMVSLFDVFGEFIFLRRYRFSCLMQNMLRTRWCILPIRNSKNSHIPCRCVFSRGPEYLSINFANLIGSL